MAAAEHQRPKAARFQDARALLRAMVDQRDVSLPLSSAHYMETHHRRQWESRNRLATVMASFSKFHTIAPGNTLIAPEMDRALQATFGTPHKLLPLQPFGYGFAHAFDVPPEPYAVPEGLAAHLQNRWGVERAANEMRELVAITGVPPEMEAEIPDYKPMSHLVVGENYARAQEDLRRLRHAEGYNKGERAARVAAAKAFSEHLDEFNAALERAQISANVMDELGPAGMTELLKLMPTAYAGAQLERMRHTASQKEWEAHDLIDITALGTATGYCDVVVTERTWVDAAKRTKLGEMYGTVFLNKLDDLPQHLL